MSNFFYIEGGYLILALVILAVTLFIVTRPFMKPGAVVKGLGSVTAILSFFIAAHYYVTTKRMEEVRIAFEAGKKIICENRAIRKGAQSLIIEKPRGWELVDDNFVSPAYSRPFFTARCIVYAR